MWIISSSIDGRLTLHARANSYCKSLMAVFLESNTSYRQKSVFSSIQQESYKKENKLKNSNKNEIFTVLHALMTNTTI